VPEPRPHDLPLGFCPREFFTALVLYYGRRQACLVLVSCMHEHPSAPAAAGCAQRAPHARSTLLNWQLKGLALRSKLPTCRKQICLALSG